MADQRIELPAYSMFVRTPVFEIDTQDGKAVVFGLLADVIVPDASDEVYIVPQGAVSRMDLISQSFYGVPDLWWVIARINSILDPLVGPALGDELRIPTKERLAVEGILSV